MNLHSSDWCCSTILPRVKIWNNYDSRRKPHWLISKESASIAEMPEMRVQSQGQEDPLEEEMATHSNIFAWETLWKKESGRLQSMGFQRIRYNWMNKDKCNRCSITITTTLLMLKPEIIFRSLKFPISMSSHQQNLLLLFLLKNPRISSTSIGS